MAKETVLTIMNSLSDFNIRIKQYKQVYTDWPECSKALDELKLMCESRLDELFIYSYLPLALCYTRWLLSEAQTHKIRKIYFIARDGWRWYSMAKLLCQALGLETDCRYLRISRYSLTDALNNAESLDKLLRYLEIEGLTEDEPYITADSGWVGTHQRCLMECAGDKICNNFKGGYYFGLYDLPKGQPKETYHTFYFEPYKDTRKKAYFNNNLFEIFSAEKVGQAVGYDIDPDGYVNPVLSEAGDPNKELKKNWDFLTEGFVKIYLEKTGFGLSDHPIISGQADVSAHPVISGQLDVSAHPVISGQPVVSDSTVTSRYGRILEQLGFKTDIAAKAFGLLCAEPAECEVESFGDLLFCHNEGRNINATFPSELSKQNLKAPLPGELSAKLTEGFRPVAEHLTLSELKSYHIKSKLIEKSGIGHSNRISAWPEGSAVRLRMDKCLSESGFRRELQAIRRYKYVSSYIKRFKL